MTLKINYLDKKKGTSKNKAFFVGRANKIAEFKGEIDDKTFNDILKFKKDKSLKDNKIISINQNLDQKIVLIYDVKADDEMEYEKLGAKFLDFLKTNEINDIKIVTPRKIKSNLFSSFIHGAELKSYEFDLYKSKKIKKSINCVIDKSTFSSYSKKLEAILGRS